MQVKSVSSSLCLQNVLRSDVDAEMAQPEMATTVINPATQLDLTTNLAGTLEAKLENNTIG